MTVIKQHLKDRHFNSNLHVAWLNENENIATFPIWNLTGQLLGYQQYRPEGSKEYNNDLRLGRYFTRKKADRIGVWGLESWSLTPTLFLTEGVFDAARLTNKNVSAIALFANDCDDSTKKWLSIVKQTRKVVAICDNDVSGNKLAKLGSISYKVESGKDLGEANDEEIQHILGTLL